jgi:2-oxoglutarate dehydrogenase E2 component (dihydrolipoamide succinyltransferase)
MAVELKIPSAGESITEVQIGQWLKAEGDYVERDEAVVEIETDKASMELPAPVGGILSQRLKQAGDIVPVGTVIAMIEEAPKPAGIAVAAGAPPAEVAAGNVATAEARVMPAARRVLAEAGLNAKDVKATGPGGRLLKEDVQRHVTTTAGGTAVSAVAAIPHGASTDRQEEVVPMTMLRRRIAERLVEAKQTMAMLTTFNEVDMSAVNELRERRSDEFQKRYDIKLGLMSFFVKATIDALQRFPAVNAEIRGTDIVYKNYYDIGIAVSTEQGLVVPVVRSAERMSFAEVELAIADLATRARQRKITIEELQGGTFTITNGGVFGSLMATPIINPPQSAILGLHAIQDRPVARDGQVVIRPMMYVALTYDHRIIDGRESVSFLKRVKECVEDPARMLVEV